MGHAPNKGVGAIAVPVGFDRWADLPSFYRPSASTVATTFDIASLIPAITNTWYVDPVNGNDGTAVVNDRTKPLLNLATGLAKTSTQQVRIINLTDHYIARTTKSWNNVQIPQSMSVIVEGDYRYISVKSGAASAPTWTAHGSIANAYQTTISAANAALVVDLLNPTQRTHPITGEAVAPQYDVLTKAGSEAGTSVAGTWFHDGATTLTVHASDDRNLVGDNYMQPMTTGNNGRAQASLSGATLYVSGIDFVGGDTPFRAQIGSSANTGNIVAFDGCSFQASSHTSGQSGLVILGPYGAYTRNCLASDNFADGMNYHSLESDGTTPDTSPNFFEDGNYYIGNGTTGSSGVSDNATTSHDFANGIRLNNYCADSDDRVLADTNSAFTWNLGCYVGQAIKTGAGKESVCALATSEVWLDTCTIATGSNNQVVVESGAFMGYHNMAEPSNTGPGSLTAY